MAQLDLSNAHISVANISPLENANLSLNQSWNFRNASKVQISNGNGSQASRDKDGILLRYYGTFTASGTEFYLFSNNSYGNHWRISNVSFSSGDTYDFTIAANLTCN